MVVVWALTHASPGILTNSQLEIDTLNIYLGTPRSVVISQIKLGPSLARKRGAIWSLSFKPCNPSKRTLCGFLEICLEFCFGVLEYPWGASDNDHL